MSGQHFWRTGRGSILLGAIWDGTREERYDLKSDPDQMTNVASIEKYAVVRRELEGSAVRTATNRRSSIDRRWKVF